jgi:polyketide cyclase/dehydrase/lipid transport protein
MHVDVVNTVVINRPVADVSQYASDPDNAPLWYENIKSIEWKTPRPVQVGSRVDFVARFLGRRLAYTYEFVEFVPGRRLTMRTPGPPFPMEMTYTWEKENGATVCPNRVPKARSMPTIQSTRVVAFSVTGDGLNGGRLHRFAVECSV